MFCMQSFSTSQKVYKQRVNVLSQRNATRPEWRNDTFRIEASDLNNAAGSPSPPTTKAVRTTRNASNLVKAFFQAPGDFVCPTARHEFLQIENKHVMRELEECLRTKQQVLHKTLKIFLKIQTHDNKKLAQNAKRQAKVDVEMGNTETGKVSPRFNSSSPDQKRENLVADEQLEPRFDRQDVEQAHKTVEATVDEELQNATISLAPHQSVLNDVDQVAVQYKKIKDKQARLKEELAAKTQQVT